MQQAQRLFWHSQPVQIHQGGRKGQDRDGEDQDSDLKLIRPEIDMRVTGGLSCK